ncbi:MAG: L-fuconolactonase [Arcticibacterium sp.]|jgi:L-fuconolactonase
MKIDAHQHFWNYDPINFSWINDEMAAIRKNFLPEDLKPILEKNGFGGSILIQVNQDETENDIFLRFAEENEFIKGVVGWIDLKASNLEDKLTHYAQYPKMKGFRHIAQSEPDDFLMDQSFIDAVAKFPNYNFTYDILVFERQLKSVLHFVRQLPNNKLIIEHIAKPNIKEKSVTRWSNYMQAISKHENVYVKVSGMVTEADIKNWKKEDFAIYLDHILDFFGPERIVYGSDWPVCLVAGTYEDQLGIVQEYFSRFTKTEQAQIFGLNAAKFYGA